MMLYRTVPAALLCALLPLACASDPQVAAREHLTRADRYAAEQRHQEAILEYRSAIQQDARLGEARVGLAETYLKVGEAREASREYVRAADLLPGDVTVQLKAGQLLLMARQFDDAKTRAEQVLATQPKNADAQILRGNALAGLHEVDAAVKQVEEAVRTNPTLSFPLTSLGALELARGRRDQAEAAFKRAVQADSTSVVARLALANFLWLSGRTSEAESVLKEAAAIDPKNLPVNRALAALLVMGGRIREAEPHFSAIAKASADEDTKILLADYYVAAGRPADARMLLLTVAESGQKPAAVAAAHLRLASQALAAGDRSEARRLVTTAVARDPSSVEALLARADLLRSDKQFDEALASAKAAVNLAPGSAQPHFAVGQIQAAAGRYTDAAAAYGEVLRLEPRAVRAELELARMNLALGKAGVAVAHARNAVSGTPADPDAQLLLARALMDSGDVAGASAPIQALAALPSPSADVLSQRGRFFRMKGDRPAARRVFEQAVAVSPSHLDALAGLSALDIESKNVTAATARIEGRLAADSANAGLFVLAARVYRASEDAAKAERALRRAIELDPNHLDAYAMLGEIYASLGKLNEARQEFQQLADRSPQSVAAHTVVGVILQAQGKLDDAQKRYERVVEIEPQAVVAANNLAWLYAERDGNLDVALQLAQTARARMPNRPEVNHTLGWVYYKKGLPSLAIPPFRESVEQAPRNPVLHYHLGLAYAKNGEPMKARTSLERALLLSKNFPGAGDASTLLDELSRRAPRTRASPGV